MPRRRLLLNFTPRSCLEFLLSADRPPMTLVICSTRAQFLQRLLPPSEEDNESAEPEKLLAPTLALLKRAANVRMVYCPQITHARAYFTLFGGHARCEGSGSGKPVLGLFGLGDLLGQDSMISVPAVSTLLAAAVDAAERSRSGLVVFENNVDMKIPLLDGVGDRWESQTVKLESIYAGWLRID
ncbi:MAG: hypothetical protein M1814_005127 [Vezdaea aestivalis]|nr:MAG: hypothetical protein M1814_005127 [Vezdaea aestivalis]